MQSYLYLYLYVDGLEGVSLKSLHPHQNVVSIVETSVSNIYPRKAYPESLTEKRIPGIQDGKCIRDPRVRYLWIAISIGVTFSADWGVAGFGTVR